MTYREAPPVESMTVRRTILCAVATVVTSASPAASAEESHADTTIPVLIHAGNDRVLLDEMVCLRAACDGRVAPGRHRVTVQAMRDGQWIDEFIEYVDIFSPAEIRVERPGALRTAALVTAMTGGAIAAAGLVIPLVVCRTKSEVQPSGQVRVYDPCADVSDGVKIGWIAGTGIGLTLALVGAFAYTLTSGRSRIATERWALLPVVSPSTRETHVGLGFVARF